MGVEEGEYLILAVQPITLGRGRRRRKNFEIDIPLFAKVNRRAILEKKKLFKSVVAAL